MIGTPEIKSLLIQKDGKILAGGNMFIKNYTVKGIDTEYKTYELLNGIGQIIQRGLFNGYTFDISAIPSGQYTICLNGSPNAITYSRFAKL